VVGYGADPDLTTEWVRENAEVTIRGNHDKACAGLEDLEWFNPVARLSAVWTQETTEPGNIEWLGKLPKGPLHVEGFQILHGSPLDEDEYLISDQDAEQVAPYLDLAVSFFGHTHLQGGFCFHRNHTNRLAKPGPFSEEYVLELDPDSTYLINPGSVGQPRDNDPRAAYAVYEPEQRLVTYCRVDYDIRGAQRKIIAAGLPEVLARRLEVGG
jgi:diadenosine tetraphosphatase ApaH/serine/threonine PP2A family protein phosphatase